MSVKFRGLYFFTKVRLPSKTARSRIETILYTVLKFQADRACFQRGVATVNVGDKME